MRRLLGAIALAWCAAAGAQEGDEAKRAEKEPAPFRWVNPRAELPEGCRHGTFRSPTMGVDVGYYVYLPPGYEQAAPTHYPVVYHLHGGRPGSEAKSVKLAAFVHAAIDSGQIEPTIYVFPNGGPVSWYNVPGAPGKQGEDVFVKELIPHIDATYRTIAKRRGRAIEGFSQGGRGTTRIMFKYPELFASAAPGGSGYGPEKAIQENGGAEGEHLQFAPGDDAWSLAKAFAGKEGRPELPILIWCGEQGFNYETNLAFIDYLNDDLEVPVKKLIQPDVGHSASGIYEKQGLKLMRFHQRQFGR